jgi:hypothetical protein
LKPEPKARFGLNLVIRHPTVDPDEITARLGISPRTKWTSGEARKTPTGTPLGGTNKESAWGYVAEFGDESRFADELQKLVDFVHPHKAFFRSITETGGRAFAFVQLPGDVGVGDEISWQVLEKLGDLRISLSVEVFLNMP